MTSDDILDLLENIASVPGKNDKLTLLEKGKTSPTFHEILRLTLDPMITFGMTRRPVASQGEGTFGSETFTILTALSHRKLTGNEARARVTQLLSSMSVKSQELFWRIISKDLRCGISVAMVNKAFPKLVKTFECMLAEAYDSRRVEFPVIVEPKLDGVRVIARIDPVQKYVTFLSREGREFTSMEHLKEPLLEVFSGTNTAWMLDGEVVSGIFNKTVSEVKRKNTTLGDASFHFFDGMPWSHFEDGASTLLEDRVYELCKRFPRLVSCEFEKLVPVPAFKAFSEEEVTQLYTDFRSQGLEGAIVKSLNTPYQRKRSWGWMKLKAQESVDVEVVAAFSGTGKYAGMLGGFVVRLDSGKECKVGSGLTDVQRREFWDGQDHLIGRLVEVEYHEMTPDGVLRHPRFVRFRDTLTGGKE